MTFFHLCNCLVLAYAPYLIIYRYSSLSEYSNIWKCGQAAIVYLITQFVKMLALATFFPITDTIEFNLTYELMKNAVDILDVMGLHFAISHFLAGKGEVRMLTAGLGWAGAHSLLTYFVVLVVGTRTTGFTWRYIQTAIESNYDLVFYLSMASLVWIFNRNDLIVQSKYLACFLLMTCVFHSAICQSLYFHFALRSWKLIAAQGVFTFGLAFLTVVAYSGVGLISMDSMAQ